MTSSALRKPALYNSSYIKLSEGCIFHEESLELSEQRSTKLYWLEIDKVKYRFKLLSNPNPKPLVNFLRSSNHFNPIAAINTNQFFLSDDSVNPKVFSYNLVANKGAVTQLPTNKRPTLIEKHGKLTFAELDAKGTILIGTQKIPWIGTNYTGRKQKNSFTAYGSFDIGLKKIPHKSRFIRIADRKSLRLACTKEEILLCFDDRRGKVKMTKICKSTMLNKHAFILKGPLQNLGKIKTIEKVKKIEVDNRTFPASVSAVSCVLSFPQSKNKIREAVRNFLLPERGKYKVMSKNYIKSWSVIIETKRKIIFFVNDGVPFLPKQKGLNLIELHNLLLQKFKFISAFVCDAGQSSKLCIRRKKKLFVYGNRHYLKYSKTMNARVNGYFGRKIPSALLVYQ